MTIAGLAAHFPALNSHTPVLIAGPTACGKSTLALQIAETYGGVVINADAIQVYGALRCLTARPTVEDEQKAPHLLYGHIAYDQPYSVGQWLRDVTPLLLGGERPIIIGGTGLYFQALTQGLADIPQISPQIVARSEQILATAGHRALAAELDAATAARIDLHNPMRVQRAWQVLNSTGRGLAAWQDGTPPPALRVSDSLPIVFDVARDWLNQRIETRFESMVKGGAVDEIRALLPVWSPELPCAKAIGARQLVAYLRGEISLETVQSEATIATQQFAKRQRTWFRSKMADWHTYTPSEAARTTP